MTTPPRDLRRLSFWIPILLCFGINSAIMVGIGLNNSRYFFDHKLIINPDTKDYLLLGQNALLHGHFSRSQGSPYVPDMLRTPVYPLFAGALDLSGNLLLVYLAQALLHVGSCALVFEIADRHFGQPAAFFASLFVATDLMWAVSNFDALSEPLFVFLVICCTERLAKGLFCVSKVKARFVLVCEAGLLLGLAILTRPVAIYVIAFYLPVVILSARRVFQPSARIVEAALLMVVSLILPGAWMARNYSTFSVMRLTNVDLNNLVYYVGAGAFEVERGLELQEAQQVISEEFNLPTYSFVQNLHLTDYPLASVVAELRHIWPRVVFKYPRSLCIASVLAIIKSIVSHNVAALAEITGRVWIAPGTGGMIRLQPEAIERLGKNGPFLVIALLWQLIHTLLSWVFALVGIILSVKSRDTRPVGILCLLCLCYFCLTISLFGLEAYYRCRFPVLPYLYLFTGVGASGLMSTLFSKRTSPQVAAAARTS